MYFGQAGCARVGTANTLDHLRRRFLGQSEIQDLCLSPLCDENVTWLDIPVDDALRMGRFQRVAELDCPLQGFFDGKWFFRDAVLQRGAFQQLHDDEGLTILLPDLMNGCDIRMIQGGGGARFAAEPFQRLRVFGKFFRQELQRHAAAKLGVLGLVDHPHSATAELLDDHVVRNGLANHAQHAMADVRASQ